MFLGNYTLTNKPDENDCQPEELVEEIIEQNHDSSTYPKTIPLMSCSEKLRCRNIPLVLRYHVHNKDRQFEKYAHHLLFMFYPFRNDQIYCQVILKHMKTNYLSQVYLKLLMKTKQKLSHMVNL